MIDADVSACSVTVTNNTEKNAWKAFKSIVSSFLWNHKTEDYEYGVSELIHYYQEIGARMLLKPQFLHTHLEHFPQTVGTIVMKEENGSTQI